jgi:hypothetical protein
MRTLLLLVVLAASVAPVSAQGGRDRVVRVVDDRGNPVPYALVAAGKATPRVANDSGVVTVSRDRSAEIEIWVRRIGYREFRAPVTPDAETGVYQVTLLPAARTVDAVVVSARASTPLTRSGFYDRIERVQKGAIVGEFITPEELDSRHISNSSDALQGRRYARVTYQGERRVPIILGRGGCAMSIVVDGQRMNGTVQDVVESVSPTSIQSLQRAQGGGRGREQERISQSPSIDELVSGREISAIEVYPSMANAPSELVQLTGGGSCGLVAIWTGGRQ